jgi:2-phosphoglycerate kinase
MIYLIGGAPRCGKTTLSKKLAYKKRVSWISTDLIAAIVKPYVQERAERRRFLIDSAEDLLLSEIEDAKALWPGIKRFILSLIKWQHDYIIEGVHLFPQLLEELKHDEKWQSLQKEIKVLYLIKTDEKLIAKGLAKGEKETDWLLQCVNTKDDFKKAAHMIQVKSEYVEKQASACGYRIVNTDKGFKKTIASLLKEF